MFPALKALYSLHLSVSVYFSVFPDDFLLILSTHLFDLPPTSDLSRMTLRGKNATQWF